MAVARTAFSPAWSVAASETVFHVDQDPVGGKPRLAAATCPLTRISSGRPLARPRPYRNVSVGGEVRRQVLRVVVDVPGHVPRSHRGRGTYRLTCCPVVFVVAGVHGTIVLRRVHRDVPGALAGCLQVDDAADGR